MSEQEQQRHYSNENIASRMQSPEQELQAEAGAEAGAEQDAGDHMELSHHEEQSGNLDGCRYSFWAWRLRTLSRRSTHLLPPCVFVCFH
jgi:hypothetical protein